jgi:hypothetical protein
MSDMIDQLTIGLSKLYFHSMSEKLQTRNKDNANTICKTYLR